MVKRRKTLVMIVAPEIKLARRIIEKHAITVPFNLEDLVRQYATLIYKSIPISKVDGVSLNLKVPGKTPTIIVNSDLPSKRQLFTLAHEFGHIIIPWHLGTIVDDIYSQSYKDFIYRIQEQEANRFAAELLMPKEWVLSEYQNIKDDLATLHIKIAHNSGVSDHAAAIHIIETLPPNIIYIAEENGKVLHSGRTTGTKASLQDEGDNFSVDFYPYIDNYSNHNVITIRYHWWKLSSKIVINTEDSRTWREILENIVQEIHPKQGVSKFKMSINGIIASAHGDIKKSGNYNVDSVLTSCLYSLRRSELENFVAHPDFEVFVKKRVQDFFNI